MKDKVKCIYNSYVAFYKYIIENKDKKNIWLFGGHGGDLFDDNSRALFEYVVENKPDIEAYWIINSKSNSLKEVEKIGKYIIKGSVENYKYFYKSNVVVFSHSMSSDIAPYSYVIPFIKKFNKETLKVFTSHGVEGFKKKNTTDGRFKKVKEKILKSYDIFISAGEVDKCIKINEWAIPIEKVKDMGMPRYDNLNYKKYKEKNKILYMPTWRNWINTNKEDIVNTEYYKNIIGLATSSYMSKVLKESNLELNIYIHHLMHKHINKFDIELPQNVKLLPKTINLQKEIIESRIVITDYSSIAWDAFYMNKPVILYRFDINKYDEYIGSYLDLRSDILGKIVYSHDECITELTNIISNTYLSSNKYCKSNYFKYQDFDNCYRYINLIQSSNKFHNKEGHYEYEI